MCGTGVPVGCKRAGKRQTWMPIEAIDVWPWGEAIDVWPWGACWLQEGWQTADLDAHKKPLMCGLGVAVGCRFKGLEGFKRLEGLERFLRVWRVLSVWRLWSVLRVWRVLRLANGKLGWP